MKHTKGKWKIGTVTNEYPKSLMIITEIKDGINPTFTLDICKVLPKVGRGQRESNAILISEAPETKAKLKEEKKRSVELVKLLNDLYNRIQPGSLYNEDLWQRAGKLIKNNDKIKKQ